MQDIEYRSLRQEISWEKLNNLSFKTKSDSSEQICAQDIWNSIEEDPKLQKNKPEFYYQVDPRNQQKILYCPARSKRPHDRAFSLPIGQSETCFCPICEGDTTKVWDIAALSKGHTFINENLYPAVFPLAEETSSRNMASGVHLLQWLSNDHHKDYHNLAWEDILVGLKSLAKIEKLLLQGQKNLEISDWDEKQSLHGYFSIIKNYGITAGCSLSHGHLQMIHSNVFPLRIEQDNVFAQKQEKGFSAFLQEENRRKFCITSYDELVKVYTPFCLKRPLEAIICFCDVSKNYLYQLSLAELSGTAKALREMTEVLLAIMKNEMGLEGAYNLVFHTGPVSGMYIEILPCTQRLGGYENLGMNLCSWRAEESTQMYQKYLENL